jgi:creatinine amidohydrolase/Fe(II)-dependent formamide hydrolase-like protein
VNAAASPRARRHRWEALLPEEFDDEFARAPVVYWPCGAVEEHGLQCVLGVDPLTAHEVCLRAAALSGGIVHPPIYLAPAYIPGFSRKQLRAKERELYPPSLWVSRDACELVYTELMESMADLGFKVCVAVGGHYPAQLLLEAIHEKTGGRIGDMRLWCGGIYGLVQEVFPDITTTAPELFGHGLRWETSNVLSLDAAFADLARVGRIKNSSFVSQLKRLPDAHLARVKDASAAFGNDFYDRAAARLAEVARDLRNNKGAANS